MMSAPGFDKVGLRAASLRARAAVSPDEADHFARRLAKICPELARAHGAAAVSVFSSIGDEVPTSLVLPALHDAGFSVALPVTGKRGTALVFRRWLPETTMVLGRMKIPEPPSDAEVVEPDLLFVPLLAFDRRGHRIGYGAGFYDITLEILRAKKAITAVGVAYAAQEVLFLPAEEHDQPLDIVVTEKDMIVCTDNR